MIRSSKSSENSWEQSYQVRDTKTRGYTRAMPYLHLLHLCIHALSMLYVAWRMLRLVSLRDEGSTFQWGQATKFASLFVRATTTSFVLGAHYCQDCRNARWERSIHGGGWRQREIFLWLLVLVSSIQLQRESVSSIAITETRYNTQFQELEGWLHRNQ